MDSDLWDLVVVGAGPAGAAAALAAKRAVPDSRVLLVDKARPGRDKVCGDGIGPDAVRVLERLGALSALRPQEAVSKFRVALVEGPVLTGTPPEPGYVVPRAEFDERLRQLALAAGAEFLLASCTGVEQTSEHARVKIKGSPDIVSKFVVAADGAYSPIRRSLGAEPNKGRHMAVAVRGYASEALDNDKVLYIGWDRVGCGLTYVWKFPTCDGRYNVGYGTTLGAGPVSSAFLNERLRLLIGDDVKLDGVRMTGHQLPLSSSRPDPVHGRVMLVGDAASLVNPLSGEGIVYALISGELSGAAAVRSSDAGVVYKAGLHAALGRHHRQVGVLSRMATPIAVSNALRSSSSDSRNLDALLALALGTGTLSLPDVARFASGSFKNMFRKG